MPQLTDPTQPQNGGPENSAKTTGRRAITISRSALVSIICSFLLAAILSALFFGWAIVYYTAGGARYSPGLRKAVLAAADILPKIRIGAIDLMATIRTEPEPLLIVAGGLDREHRTSRFPAPDDPGYLLLAHVDKSAKQSVVDLIRISDGRRLVRWLPDIPALAALLKEGRESGLSRVRMRALNPVLQPNGDIVYNTMGGPLSRQSACGNIVWAAEGVYHHGNELDGEGNTWTPLDNKDFLPRNPWLRARMRDDAIAEVSPDGRRLGKWSFSGILINNGLRALLVGTALANPPSDPIHMNDIQPALSSSRYWEKGDLLVSARNMSTVFLYRPSTGRIVWYKTGPWLSQHDVNFLGDSRITVFGNDAIGASQAGPEFLRPENSNQVYVFDFATGDTYMPYARLMTEQRVRTSTEGRGEVLPDGGLFVEETNYGRLLRFTKDKLLWSYVNWYDEKRIGLVSWSRYLTPEQVREPLAAIAARGCLAR